jgi:curved DNA-binding protein CbpA
MANDIKKYPVPLIFKKILKDNLSGMLQVSHRYFSKELLFIDAHLVFARSTLESERLGEILRNTGKITESQLKNALEIEKQFAHQRKISDILLKTTQITSQDIYNGLLNQMKAIAESTFSLTEGEWRFTVKTSAARESHTFKIRVPEIIHEGVKKIKDFSYFERRFFFRCPVITNLDPAALKYLSPGDTQFYSMLSEFSNIPVEKIIAGSEIPGHKFWRRLILLYLLNALDFAEFTVDEDLNKNVEDVNELYEKVHAKQVDFYDLFEVKPSAGIKEIKDRYFDYSKKYHPDRINAAPDSTVMMKANEVFAEINKAFETLSNEDKKRDYDARKFRQGSPQDSEQVSPGKKAKDLYLKANVFYKNKKYFEAASLMEEAVKIENNRANYYLLLGLSQAKLPAFIRRAENSLKKAAELEPWNADPIFALGELYRSENLVKKAEEYYQKALDINMEHTLAGKAMHDMEKYFGGKKGILSFFGKKGKK